MMNLILPPPSQVGIFINPIYKWWNPARLSDCHRHCWQADQQPFSAAAAPDPDPTPESSDSEAKWSVPAPSHGSAALGKEQQFETDLWCFLL